MNVIMSVERLGFTVRYGWVLHCVVRTWYYDFNKREGCSNNI